MTRGIMALRRAVRQHLPSVIRPTLASSSSSSSGSRNSGPIVGRSLPGAIRSVSSSVPSGQPSADTSFVSQDSPVSPFAAAAASAPFSYTSAASAAAERTIRDGPRTNWSREEIQAIYDSPLLDLLFYGVSLILALISHFRTRVQLIGICRNSRILCFADEMLSWA